MMMKRTHFRSMRGQRGFTLIELVAAFVVFALGFGILMSILTDNIHVTRESADITRAALWAQSLIDMQGVGEGLQEGTSSGRFDDKYTWVMDIGKIQPPEEPQSGGVTPGNAMMQGPQITTVGNTIDLYQLDLTVLWGPSYLQHRAHFVTLRAQDSQQNGNANGIGLTPPPVRRQGSP
jgi:general secretion pathway protein I